MKNLIVFLGLLAAAVGAQTIASRATLSGDAARVLILTPQGPVGATLGEGLTITTTPGGLVLSGQRGAAVRHVRVTVASDGSIAAAGLITLCREGVVLTEGADWERTATGARLTKQGFSQGENWSAFTSINANGSTAVPAAAR